MLDACLFSVWHCLLCHAFESTINGAYDRMYMFVYPTELHHLNDMQLIVFSFLFALFDFRTDQHCVKIVSFRSGFMVWSEATAFAMHFVYAFSAESTNYDIYSWLWLCNGTVPWTFIRPFTRSFVISMTEKRWSFRYKWYIKYQPIALFFSTPFRLFVSSLFA